MKTPALIGTIYLSLISLSTQAQQITYTENSSGENEVPLGYPVPQPVASTQAVDGFRDYASVIAHLQALALSDTELSAQIVGQSHKGEDIWAFSLSDADELSADHGLVEASILHSAGIHAREWASVAAVSYLIEKLQSQAQQNGLARYLVDQLNLVWVPVLNPDGFLSTQKNYQHSILGLDSGPRDGRMRRKNLLDSDDDLASESNNLLGVDLNRNIGPYWGSTRGSSGSESSLLYRGNSRESEPETQALLSARDWALGERLRLYIDTHSFGRILFFNETGNQRLFNITNALANKLGQVPSREYQGIFSPQGAGIGATDEYFSEVHQVPAYTLEIEPGLNGATEYGGRGVDHDGFLLPAAEVPRMREEIYDLSVLAYYHQAGPPSVETVEIRQASNAELVYRAHWATQANESRQLNTQQNAVLMPGETYQFPIPFNHPRRVRDEQGEISQYPGQSIALAPTLALDDQHGRQQQLMIAISGWQANGQRYANDSWQGNFTINSQLQGEELVLDIRAPDMAGLNLDSNPSTTADWQNGSWQAYENSLNRTGDSGANDRNLKISFSGAPVRSNGGGSGSLSLLLLILITAYRRQR